MDIDESAYYQFLLESRICMYEWDLQHNGKPLFLDEAHSLEEAILRESYLHEPYFPGEE